jgi:hypothetical protein
MQRRNEGETFLSASASLLREICSLIIKIAQSRGDAERENVKLGYLLNFDAALMKEGIVRAVNGLEESLRVSGPLREISSEDGPGPDNEQKQARRRNLQRSVRCQRGVGPEKLLRGHVADVLPGRGR